MCSTVVAVSCRYARIVCTLYCALVLVLGWFAIRTIGVDTNLGKLLSPDLPWKQAELRFDTLFPQFSGLLVVVVDGDTPESTEVAAAALAQRLRAESGLFESVERPDDLPFFRRNGLLFLSEAAVVDALEDIVAAQPLLGSLAADPSLRGVFDTLALGLEGVKRDETAFSALAPALEAVADAAERALAGRPRPMSWQTLLSDAPPHPTELRRLILTRPARDFGRIGVGGKAMAAVREAARVLQLTPANGITVRMTGHVAIQKEELDTLRNGSTLALFVSLGLVSVLLVLGLRSARIIAPILLTLLGGLVATTAFAAASVGTLNPISIAFAVLFLGLAVDFGIQFATRTRQERHGTEDAVLAMRRAAAGVGGPIVLAAVTTAAGFLAFLPTAYRGVSELGLIAGAGMVIAVIFNLTLLPALLALFRPPSEPRPVGFLWAAPADRWLARRRRTGLVTAGLLTLGAGLVLPGWSFDFNPMHLRDPEAESVATAMDLAADPNATPFTVDLLTSDLGAASALAERLRRRDEIGRVISLDSFVPADQGLKLAMIEEVAFLLDPTLNPFEVRPSPSVAEELAAIESGLDRLRGFPGEPAARHLATALSAVMARGEAILPDLSQALLANLPLTLDRLRTVLTAQPVGIDDLPATLVEDWVSGDGQARVLALPAGDPNDNAVLASFVAAVEAERGVAPATGTAVTIIRSAETILAAFAQAGAIALGMIFVILLAVLRRLLDVLRVLLPMALAGLTTATLCVVLGLPLNFANVIALPLLLGIGVAFNIYFVLAWRAGTGGHLQTATARAVVFSALTTLVAFGSLALSTHPGTASMGLLLVVALVCTLVMSLFLLPAILGAPLQADPRS